MTTENIDTAEDEEEIKYVRPTAMTLISLWLILSGLLVVWFAYKGYGTSSIANILFLATGALVSLVCGVGFWLMKKWALYIFAAFAVLDQIALLLLGRWNFFSLVYFAVVIFFGYKYRSEMT